MARHETRVSRCCVGLRPLLGTRPTSYTSRRARSGNSPSAESRFMPPCH
ncbi:hypothetical protein HMPREF0004_4949 [Achromobacter piechaudii ATCC 43553]|uniref:Uncharacterized protein n=1 Tax=Achromobacter piechaudii ATCC 43553 TaxID=742159 RepID=D4XHK2_9BURK|nr:hypothetical protein HMPREF0004_4949 [Achromobacter piechaudii ATCC 43553]